MRWVAGRILVLGLFCCLLSGCFAQRRQEIREKAMDLQTRVALLQQRVDAQERRLEKLEGEVAELSKRR